MSKWHKNWFSNMLPFDEHLVWQNIQYRTPEHFYQAQKVYLIPLKQKIAQMGPFEAKKALQNNKDYPIRPDWEEIKLSVMEQALRWKFQKGTSWYKKLMETGQDEIVEWNNWSDIWWGRDIETGKGRNELGKLLMKIRSEYYWDFILNSPTLVEEHTQNESINIDT